MRCVTCGTENEPGRKFCGECGMALTVACPACGTPNGPGVKFCGECGAKLGDAIGEPSAEEDEPRPTPVSERRLVSVLFADLVGFTTLSEARDPEEVRELLTRYFDTCRKLIAGHGGVVEKFIGDAVMAVWGTPTANEDDAERAVRAALELTEAVGALGEEVGAPDLRARAGVLTGEAAVTLEAQGQGMVAGDLINTASRIQSAAEPGAVYVGEATRRATEAAIVFEDAGTHELKGKAEPLPLWRAVRVVGLRGGAAKAAGLEPPFVGRDRELRLIKQLFHGTADERTAHLVSVFGVGGIGKSRLVWEFEKYIDGLADTIRWRKGRCLSYGEGVTYWALAEMVRTEAGILEAEATESAFPKLREAVERAVSDAQERRWVEPRLAQLLGLEEGATGERADLFAAWRLFFERLSEQIPTVLVFEDIHWADSSLLDFIEYLLDWSKDHAIFVLTLSRPEFADRRPTWGAGKRAFASLYLEPLSHGAMEVLLTGPVPGLSEELRNRILERAEGVPFYAVETVRMLIDRGLLVREGNAYRPTGPIETLEVPETLQALIAARLDGLAEDERRLLQDAAVLGRFFTVQGLSALTERSVEQLEPDLTSLVRKEILTLQADPLSPERGQYGFIQDLVKRIAYETLAKKERKARHLAVAAHLESVWGQEESEFAEIIAAHYQDAYRAAPEAPDAGEIKIKARERLVQAGERSASLAASLQAQRYFERALELSDDPIAGADLSERAGEMARMGGRIEEARAHFEAAIRLFESSGAAHPAARVSARLGVLDWQLGRLMPSIERMERAFTVLMTEEPDEDLARLAADLGRLHYFAGDPERAMARTEVGLETAERLVLPEPLSEALNTKGLLLIDRLRLEEGLALLERALKVALEHDIPSAAFRAYNNLAYAMWVLDRAEDAYTIVQPAVEFARRVGDRPWEWSLTLNGADSLISLGRWDEALAQFETVMGSEGFDPALVGIELVSLVQLHTMRGDVDEAERVLVMTGTEASEDFQSRGAAAVARTMILRAKGDLQGALGAVRQVTDALVSGVFSFVREAHVEAAEIALGLDDLAQAEERIAYFQRLIPVQMTPLVRAQMTRLEARLLAARGEVEGVEKAFKSSTGSFRELHIPYWLAIALAEQGQWLIGQDRTEDASPVLNEAREIFVRLGARPWLERVERIAPSPVLAGSPEEAIV